MPAQPTCVFLISQSLAWFLTKWLVCRRHATAEVLPVSQPKLTGLFVRFPLQGTFLLISFTTDILIHSKWFDCFLKDKQTKSDFKGGLWSVRKMGVVL